MKILALVLVLTLISFFTFAKENKSDKQYSIGLGLGSSYSGIGTNFSFLSKTDMKYISAGCIEYDSYNGATCGFGVGWIMTDLFDTDSNKHGLGVYASLVGHESYYSYEGNGYTYKDKDIYGTGISYIYFMNGINASGFNFGASMHITNAEFEDSYGSFFQVGYQF